MNIARSPKHFSGNTNRRHHEVWQRRNSGPLGAIQRPEILSPSPWQRERVQRLARICRCMDRGAAQGKRVHEMLVWFAWRWKGRQYKCEPTRSIQFGYGTLKMAWYRWKNGGRTPNSIALHYCGPRKLEAKHIELFANACLVSGVTSLAAARRQLPRPAATMWAYRHALPLSVRSRITELLAARRKVAHLERSARRAVNGMALGKASL